MKYVVVITCAGFRFTSEVMSHEAAQRCVADYMRRNSMGLTVPTPAIEESK